MSQRHSGLLTWSLHPSEKALGFMVESGCKEIRKQTQHVEACQEKYGSQNEGKCAMKGFDSWRVLPQTVFIHLSCGGPYTGFIFW